nr:MAG TPA: hypothetical protein [Caudoviricetes sp.]
MVGCYGIRLKFSSKYKSKKSQSFIIHQLYFKSLNFLYASLFIFTRCVSVILTGLNSKL